MVIEVPEETLDDPERTDVREYEGLRGCTEHMVRRVPKERRAIREPMEKRVQRVLRDLPGSRVPRAYRESKACKV
jgi:hypothetical protein